MFGLKARRALACALALFIAVIVLHVFAGPSDEAPSDEVPVEITSVPDKTTRPINKLAPKVKRPCGSHVNRNILDHREKLWAETSDDIIQAKSTELFQFIADIPSTFSYSDFKFKGRGIVYMSYGGAIDYALASIAVLRMQHNCQLPVEIWYVGAELSMEQIRSVSRLRNVTPRDLLVEQEKYGVLEKFWLKQQTTGSRNYFVKAFIIMLSSFEEVLYLDSDNMPLQNPEILFDSEQYAQMRSLFWPDYWKFGSRDVLWRIMRLECEDESEQEAGQLVIDKKAAFNGLLAAMFIQYNHEFYFQYMLGDKDSFRLAWKITKTDYYMNEHPAATGGNIEPGNVFSGHSMVQHALDGSLMFAHMTLLKNRSMRDMKSGVVWEAIQYLKRQTPRELSSTGSKVEYEVDYPTCGFPHGIAYDTTQIRIETSAEVVNALGAEKAVDSFKIVTVPWNKYDNGKYSWLDDAFFFAFSSKHS